MKKLNYYLCSLFMLVITTNYSFAQGKLEINDVRNATMRNSGTIMENNEIRGYYFFYQSDKVDKKTNEYTLQISDENLNKIKDIVFTDNKNIRLLESSYNGSSLMFLFYDNKEKTLEYRAYGFDGKQKMTYTKELNNRSKMLIESTYGSKSEQGSNEALFDIEGKGYVTVYPVKEGKFYSYEVNYFFTDRQKQWTYGAAEEQDDKWASALYLGSTDSLILFEVIKQKTLLSGKPHSWLLGLNMYSGRKAFEISTETESDYKFYPMNISSIKGKKDFFLMGTYYDKDDRVMKDKSLGLAAWTMDVKGKIVAKKYNSWDTQIGKYLDTDQQGRVADIGYIFFHKILQTDDGNFFAIGEGYKKVVSAAGVMSTLLGGGGASTFKIKVTDMIVMKFNKNFEIQGANIYDKFNNGVELPAGAGLTSPHMMALMVKSMGQFDYNFTKSDKTASTFVTGYSDYEKAKDYKGLTFNTITYANSKFTTDKFNLKTKASYINVFPAKTGSIMVMEYFKKDKRLDMRLEKMN
ncbi:MAG: DUF6770 family protein [Ferruginibacter sp.]